MIVAAVLLAAGRSRRFGQADKLEAQIDGLPLRLHAAGTIARLPLAHRIVVTGPEPAAWPGFTIVVNDHPDAGMARSVALGVVAARACGAEAVLIALADMPFVTEDHFRRLLAAGTAPGSRIGSSDGRTLLPPALFGADWFDALAALDGDRGARALLDGADRIEAAPESLIDIDRPSDIAAMTIDHRAG